MTAASPAGKPLGLRCRGWRLPAGRAWRGARKRRDRHIRRHRL